MWRHYDTKFVWNTNIRITSLMLDSCLPVFTKVTALALTHWSSQIKISARVLITEQMKWPDQMLTSKKFFARDKTNKDYTNLVLTSNLQRLMMQESSKITGNHPRTQILSVSEIPASSEKCSLNIYKRKSNSTFSSNRKPITQISLNYEFSFAKTIPSNFMLSFKNRYKVRSWTART